jgi:hypothetical protein
MSVFEMKGGARAVASKRVSWLGTDRGTRVSVLLLIEAIVAFLPF